MVEPLATPHDPPLALTDAAMLLRSWPGASWTSMTKRWS